MIVGAYCTAYCTNDCACLLHTSLCVPFLRLVMRASGPPAQVGRLLQLLGRGRLDIRWGMGRDTLRGVSDAVTWFCTLCIRDSSLAPARTQPFLADAVTRFGMFRVMVAVA